MKKFELLDINKIRYVPDIENIIDALGDVEALKKKYLSRQIDPETVKQYLEEEKDFETMELNPLNKEKFVNY